MRYFQFSDGHVQGFDNPTPEQIVGAVEISADQFAEIARTPVVTPAMAQETLQALAKVQLNIVTGQTGQFMRAQVAGLAPNDTRLAPWQTYVQALRAIANGTDTTSTMLPTQPAYIQGT